MLDMVQAAQCLGSPSKESWVLVDRLVYPESRKHGTLPSGIYRFEAVIPGSIHVGTAMVAFDHPVGYAMQSAGGTGSSGWPVFICDGCPGILIDLDSQTYANTSMYYMANHNGSGFAPGSQVPNISSEDDMDSASGIHIAIYRLP